MQKHTYLKPSSGFSMVELLMVIVTLGIIGTVALPGFMDLSQEAKVAASRDYLNNIKTAIDIKRQQMILRCNLGPGRWPTATSIIANDVTESGSESALCSMSQLGGDTRESRFLDQSEVEIPINPFNGRNDIVSANFSDLCSLDPAAAGYYYDETTGEIGHPQISTSCTNIFVASGGESSSSSSVGGGSSSSSSEVDCDYGYTVGGDTLCYNACGEVVSDLICIASSSSSSSEQTCENGAYWNVDGCTCGNGLQQNAGAQCNDLCTCGQPGNYSSCDTDDGYGNATTTNYDTYNTYSCAGYSSSSDESSSSSECVSGQFSSPNGGAGGWRVVGEECWSYIEDACGNTENYVQDACELCGNCVSSSEESSSSALACMPSGVLRYASSGCACEEEYYTDMGAGCVSGGSWNTTDLSRCESAGLIAPPECGGGSSSEDSSSTESSVSSSCSDTFDWNGSDCIYTHYEYESCVVSYTSSVEWSSCGMESSSSSSDESSSSEESSSEATCEYSGSNASYGEFYTSQGSCFADSSCVSGAPHPTCCQDPYGQECVCAFDPGTSSFTCP